MRLGHPEDQVPVVPRAFGKFSCSGLTERALELFVAQRCASSARLRAVLALGAGRAIHKPQGSVVSRDLNYAIKKGRVPIAPLPDAEGAIGGLVFDSRVPSGSSCRGPCHLPDMRPGQVS